MSLLKLELIRGQEFKIAACILSCWQILKAGMQVNKLQTECWTVDVTFPFCWEALAHEWHWLAGIVALLEQRACLQRWRQSTVASPSASRQAPMLGPQTRSLPRSSRIWSTGGGRARNELGQECEQHDVTCSISHF